MDGMSALHGVRRGQRVASFNRHHTTAQGFTAAPHFARDAADTEGGGGGGSEGGKKAIVKKKGPHRKC